MALYRDGGFVADDWSFPAEAEPVPAAGKIALPKARLTAAWTDLAGRADPIGLVLNSGENLDGLAEAIPLLSLVKLVIPRYADGRLYSIARLLRDRYGFKGEIRAAGDVLRDQIIFLARAGFDAFEVTHEGTIKALREGAIIAVHHHYQPASHEIGEAKPGPRPWLRLSSVPGVAQ
ncbi:DUF934 domain-containing protein [Phreatobacter stygius]|uniref:DUF934 domain-containing protein n=1 Tax=Phreatobacter stygius TaxID=1940610 RepID=A0A4D7B0J5_9HYPH|nr:DUF934 domain-containing protein [Phreatobacter stygius]QCI65015.1 DUF934 domain-containing protein [Phreatobacter stygius]